jgi:hypothetical protein
MEEPMNMNGKYTSKGNDKYEDESINPISINIPN